MNTWRIVGAGIVGILVIGGIVMSQSKLGSLFITETSRRVAPDEQREAKNRLQEYGATHVLAVGEFAPPGAMTFGQRYKVVLHLPMPESEFLQILNRLHIQYDRIPPNPSALTETQKVGQYYLSDVSHTLQVHAGYNKVLRRTEIYEIFVARDGQVIRIEDRFGIDDLWSP